MLSELSDSSHLLLQLATVVHFIVPWRMLGARAMGAILRDQHQDQHGSVFKYEFLQGLLSGIC